MLPVSHTRMGTGSLISPEFVLHCKNRCNSLLFVLPLGLLGSLFLESRILPTLARSGRIQ